VELRASEDDEAENGRCTAIGLENTPDCDWVEFSTGTAEEGAGSREGSNMI